MSGKGPVRKAWMWNFVDAQAILFVYDFGRGSTCEPGGLAGGCVGAELDAGGVHGRPHALESAAARFGSAARQGIETLHPGIVVAPDQAIFVPSRREAAPFDPMDDNQGQPSGVLLPASAVPRFVATRAGAMRAEAALIRLGEALWAATAGTLKALVLPVVEDAGLEAVLLAVFWGGSHVDAPAAEDCGLLVVGTGSTGLAGHRVFCGRSDRGGEESYASAWAVQRLGGCHAIGWGLTGHVDLNRAAVWVWAAKQTDRPLSHPA